MGHVGTGFTDRLLKALMEVFESIKTDVSAFNVEIYERVTWLKLVLVCEVIYQLVTRDCKIRLSLVGLIVSQYESLKKAVSTKPLRRDCLISLE